MSRASLIFFMGETYAPPLPILIANFPYFLINSFLSCLLISAEIHSASEKVSAPIGIIKNS
ncbi:hypothetical protein ES705_29552 [subsurface metagenome]